MRAVQIIVVIVGLGGLAYWLTMTSGKQVAQEDEGATSAIAEVVLPEALSTNAQIGKTAFEAKCAACHGINAVGQAEIAPPLVHKIYEPSHHGDEAFQRAVSGGVRQHHWSFGNMPAIEGLTRGDVAMIIAYVRELQQANGIH